MRRRRSPAPQPDLNLTNLMDVVLCILVVFMITAPLMTQGVKVELPKAEAPSVDEKKSVTVSFDSRQRVYVDGEETSREDFPEAFAHAWGGDLEKAVLIEGDRSVPYGTVLETVGEIRKAGAAKIGFLTEPPQRR
jgi:biopolymer transport protein TolR